MTTLNRTSVRFRKATREDVGALKELIARSARDLARSDYTPDQIEAALVSAWGVDTQLIDDGTCFVGLADEIVACGGWSWRRTLFGGDGRGDRAPEVLDPGHDAARIRAFFVDPRYARLGIGRDLLRLCETEAQQHGFTAAELLATLPGQRLYSACGYTSTGTSEIPLPGGGTITFVPMSKRLDPHGGRDGDRSQPRMREQLYHGTKADLQPGDLIAPGHPSNYGQSKNAGYVYLSATLEAATWGAELAVGDGRGSIYVVEPTGPIADDPNVTDTKFPGNPTMSYRSRDPLRVTAEVLDWKGHSSEELQTMKDHLERLKQLGIEAIED
jgi:GNAT superfamily N-acetyltransferase